jgi:transcriptional regulator with XRE-family HTH domain
MQVVSFESARRFKAAQERAGIQEYSFRDEYELCAFVAGEIRSSKIKYTKLADKSGVCASTISNLAHDITKSPRAATLLKILKALGFEIFVRG